jgi:hypothetical protein
MAEMLNEQEKKPSFIWKLIKNVIIFLFPGLYFLKINSLMKSADRINPHPWFKKQRQRNLIESLVSSSPFLISVVIFSRMIYVNNEFWRNLMLSKAAFLSIDIGKAINKLVIAFSNDYSQGMFQLGGTILFIGAFLSFILGAILIYKHPIIQETNKLKKMLERNGVFEKDDKRIALATPLGFLIDITGSTGREMKENERIWMPLNQKVTDWVEDPHQRSLCFFKKAFPLKKEYIYKI